MPVGGKREGAGRPKGSVSPKKLELAELAKVYAPQALQVLAGIMTGGESEAARVSAANALLDRGFGKPPQAIQHGGDPDNPMPLMIPVQFVKPDETA